MGLLADDVGEGWRVGASGLLAWLSVLENIGSIIGRCIRGCQGAVGMEGSVSTQRAQRGTEICLRNEKSLALTDSRVDVAEKFLLP